MCGCGRPSLRCADGVLGSLSCDFEKVSGAFIGFAASKTLFLAGFLLGNECVDELDRMT